MLSNGCDAVGNGYGGQSEATIESTFSNACDTVGNGNGGQTPAITESIVSNACDAVGNGYGGHTAATIESIVSNACDAAANLDGFNRLAIGIPRGISFIITTIICIIRHCSGAGDGEGAAAKRPCEVGAAGAVVGFSNEGQTEQEH